MTMQSIQTLVPAAMARALPRSTVIGVIGFLTLVDLFAAQAILPTLAQRYGVTPGAIGFAVNSGTIGMAVSGLVVSLAARRVDRRRGIWLSLALLSIPTALLATAPDLATFTALRIAQGVFMAAAFTLTMAYLAERAGPADAATALAAYVTGVVASNLFGRLASGTVAETAGLSANFYVFAALNLAGAALVAATLTPSLKMAPMCSAPRSALAAWAGHLGNPALRAAFGLGFLILFVFIGVFTYVNFELAKPPLSLSPMHLGFVYLVFAPALVTTPLAGRAVGRFGLGRTLRAALGAPLLALTLLGLPSLAAVIFGLTVVGVGTFLAQAVATGFVGRTARSDRAAASGLYLASYYLGGLAGAAALGQVYERLGWNATLCAIAAALFLAMLLSSRMAAPRGRRSS